MAGTLRLRADDVVYVRAKAPLSETALASLDDVWVEDREFASMAKTIAASGATTRADINAIIGKNEVRGNISTGNYMSTHKDYVSPPIHDGLYRWTNLTCSEIKTYPILSTNSKHFNSAP